MVPCEGQRHMCQGQVGVDVLCLKYSVSFYQCVVSGGAGPKTLGCTAILLTW